jgi:hypothetical protein
MIRGDGELGGSEPPDLHTKRELATAIRAIRGSEFDPLAPVTAE